MSPFTVREIWRYPVKSMAGEQLDECELAADGLVGDRCWALRDEERGCVADARALPRLLDVGVRYARPPAATQSIPDVKIMLPGHAPLCSADASVHAALSRYLARTVTLWPRVPADQRAHYRRVWPEDAARLLCELFGVADVSELPDLSELPPEIIRYQTIPGTYFDAFPVHLVTTGSLAALREVSGSDTDVRRFRPNLVIEGAASENGWLGRRFRIGSAVLCLEAACPRCVMVTHPRDGLPSDRDLLRVIHQKFNHTLGAYASVERQGSVRLGDPMEAI